jgi:hypothetical protein
MNPGPAAEIMGLLKAWAGGDRVALERVTPLVYAEFAAHRGALHG